MPRIRAASIDEHKELTRRALLDAAWRLIADAGTAEVPLGEVAMVAGVGRTTFYDYFVDRDDVIASLVEEKLPDVIAEMIGDIPSGLAPVERLERLIVATVEFVATDRVFGVILHREVGRMGPEAQRRIRASHAQLATELTSIHSQGVEDGVFRPIPGYLAGRLIQDSIMSAARALIEDETRCDVVTSEIVDFLLGGLRKSPSTED
ncbi:MAG TPA: TetR family transcriptional regulator [Acidimicrobiia bacterium]|jgi:AcrR family transcriptional regulator|nr:TetR family transcriptional regulator [Acidimicrobiia bacterium]